MDLGLYRHDKVCIGLLKLELASDTHELSLLYTGSGSPFLTLVYFY
jgi:hypothetical protein